MSGVYKVYIIKCKTNNKVYVGRTESTNPKYNPINTLYNRYKKDSSKYIALGECIKEHGFKNFVFTFISEGKTDEESQEIMEKIKEKIKDRILNDENKPLENYFEEDLKEFAGLI